MKGCYNRSMPIRLNPCQSGDVCMWHVMTTPWLTASCSDTALGNFIRACSLCMPSHYNSAAQLSFGNNVLLLLYCLQLVNHR